MANKFQVKRTSVTGRTPNTTSSGNTHFIDTGELALNLTDGKMFSSNGTTSFEIGANLANLSVAGNASIAAIVANGSVGSIGQTLTSNGTGIYWAVGAGTGTVTEVNTGSGLTGGPITSTGTIDVVANNGIVANSSGVFANQGTGLVVNATGIHVNSSYIGTLTSNNSNNLNGQPASFYTNATNLSTGTLGFTRLPSLFLGTTTIQSTSAAQALSGITTLAAGNTSITGFVNATSSIQGGSTLTIAGAASGITTLSAGNTSITGFVNASASVNSALLTVGTSFIANTTQVTLTGIPLSANGSTGTAGQVLHSNGTTGSPYWATDDNSGGTVTSVSGTGTVSGLTLSGSVTTSGSLTLGGSISGALSGITTLATGNTTVTGFANVTGTIQGGSSLSISGAASGITTLAAGNTTITGFANVSVSVNSALLTVGTNFVANITGAYHTGVVNASSHTTSGVTANATGVYPSSNTVGTALGSTTNRWSLIANTGSFTGQVEIDGNSWNTADGTGAIYLDSSTGNRIDWNINGVAAPAVTTRSAGTKLVLYPGVAAASVDFGLGIETNHMWFSVADTGDGFKWYANTTQLAVANTSGFTFGSGGIFPSSNTVATSLGSATQRWVINANTGSFSGTVNALSYTIGTSFVANSTAITLGTIGAASNGVAINNNLLTVGNTSVNTTVTPLQIQANQDDTVSTPSYTWSGNTTTGFYRPATDTIAITVGGTEELRVNNSVISVNTNISVGNVTSGYINLGRASPTTSAGFQQEKHFTVDGTTYGTFVDTLLNNTAYTTTRSHYGGYYLTTANTLSQNTLGSTISTDLYGLTSFIYNAETTGGNSRLNDMMSVYADARNYANGLVANSVDNMWAYRGLSRNFGSGVITNAYGVGVVVGAGNTTTTGNITTAYGVSSVISSNTASTIGTGYLFYGSHTGATTTTKYGVFITGESNNYFSSNVSIAGSLALTGQFVANGTSGTSGQVLTTNATGTYWSTVSSGLNIVNDTTTNAARYISFNEATSGSTANLGVSSTKLTFNPSTGIVSATQFSATSDERLKQNVEVIGDPLDKLTQLRGITFNYISSGDAGVGVVAQDVERIFPELVNINSEGYKSVMYDGLIGLLIESIKDQQKQINELKQVIERIC